MGVCSWRRQFPVGARARQADAAPEWPSRAGAGRCREKCGSRCWWSAAVRRLRAGPGRASPRAAGRHARAARGNSCRLRRSSAAGSAARAVAGPESVRARRRIGGAARADIDLRARQMQGRAHRQGPEAQAMPTRASAAMKTEDIIDLRGDCPASAWSRRLPRQPEALTSTGSAPQRLERRARVACAVAAAAALSPACRASAPQQTVCSRLDARRSRGPSSRIRAPQSACRGRKRWRRSRETGSGGRVQQVLPMAERRDVSGSGVAGTSSARRRSSEPCRQQAGQPRQPAIGAHGRTERGQAGADLPGWASQRRRRPRGRPRGRQQGACLHQDVAHSGPRKGRRSGRTGSRGSDRDGRWRPP